MPTKVFESRDIRTLCLAKEEEEFYKVALNYE